MRVFDYKCENCFKLFEEWVAPDDGPVLCPDCQSDQVVVVWLSAPGFPQGFHPYNKFRNVGEDYDKSIRSVVPKSFKGSKSNG